MNKLCLAVMLAVAGLIGAAEVASAARYPLNSWTSTGNPFWSCAVGCYHTAFDAQGGAGTSVYAPFGGQIKEAKYHSGYGGTIIGETYLAGETITWVIGHVDGSGGFSVRAGQWVSEGQYIGKLAPKGYWTGNYAAHCHFGIHKSGYNPGGTACGGGWIYQGYSAGCDWGNWLNPGLAVPFANTHYQQGDIYKVGYPVTHMQYSCGMDYREYNGGSFGRCMIAMGDNGSWLVRTGFYDKYVAMGGPCSALGKPRSNEYSWYAPQFGRTVARQNFNGGYMLWHNNTAYVYNNGGARIASAEPVVGEPLAARYELSLAISPNPVQAWTRIEFTLPSASTVELGLYDVSGRLVAQLAGGEHAAGPHAVDWQLVDQSGSRVKAGMYFVRLAIPDRLITKKLVIAQ